MNDPEEVTDAAQVVMNREAIDYWKPADGSVVPIFHPAARDLLTAMKQIKDATDARVPDDADTPVVVGGPKFGVPEKFQGPIVVEDAPKFSALIKNSWEGYQVGVDPIVDTNPELMTRDSILEEIDRHNRLIRERREVVVRVPQHRVWELFRLMLDPDHNPNSRDIVRHPGVPKDAIVVSVHEEPTSRSFLFTLAHPSFDPVPDGDHAPVLSKAWTWEFVRRGDELRT